jgi:ATP-dependent Clp protease ATP-binding subunit ClpB
MTAGTQRKLDPSVNSKDTKLLLQQFSRKVVGQSAATQVLTDILENFRAGFGDPAQPIGNALFLGPTGTGKTHVCETFAEALFGTKNACLRIDCAEFQHSHEIAKLLGSPPGYLGHRETHPIFTQERLNQYHKDSLNFSIILFDEIEKASDAVWNLLLGILDKASLTLGDNRVVNFSKTIIIMTSNLGAREMAHKDIGYGETCEEFTAAVKERKALSAAKAKFSPEFMNRLQHTVMFETLTEKQIEAVLEVEIEDLAFRLYSSSVLRVAAGVAPCAFSLAISPAARKTLATQGFDSAYGARHLKRTLDSLVQHPLAKLYNSGQIQDGDVVVVDDPGTGTFDFYTHPSPTRLVTPTPMPSPIFPVFQLRHRCDTLCLNSYGVKICGH